MNKKQNHSSSYFFLLILLLVTLDQVAKLIISTYFMEADHVFFSNFLGFKPFLDTKNPYFINRVLHLNIRHSTLLICNFVILLIIFDVYKIRVKASSFTNLEKISYIFLFATSLSSLLDKAIYHGRLTYIVFFNMKKDLKDIYIAVAVVLLLILLIKKLKEYIHKEKNKTLTKIENKMGQ